MGNTTSAFRCRGQTPSQKKFQGISRPATQGEGTYLEKMEPNWASPRNPPPLPPRPRKPVEGASIPSHRQEKVIHPPAHQAHVRPETKPGSAEESKSVFSSSDDSDTEHEPAWKIPRPRHRSRSRSSKARHASSRRAENPRAGDRIDRGNGNSARRPSAASVRSESVARPTILPGKAHMAPSQDSRPAKSRTCSSSTCSSSITRSQTPQPAGSVSIRCDKTLPPGSASSPSQASSQSKNFMSSSSSTSPYGAPKSHRSTSTLRQPRAKAGPVDRSSQEKAAEIISDPSVQDSRSAGVATPTDESLDDTLVESSPGAGSYFRSTQFLARTKQYTPERLEESLGKEKELNTQHAKLWKLYCPCRASRGAGKDPTCLDIGRRIQLELWTRTKTLQESKGSPYATIVDIRSAVFNPSGSLRRPCPPSWRNQRDISSKRFERYWQLLVPTSETRAEDVPEVMTWVCLLLHKRPQRLRQVPASIRCRVDSSVSRCVEEYLRSPSPTSVAACNMIKHSEKILQGRQAIALLESGLELHPPQEVHRQLSEILEHCHTLHLSALTFEELANFFGSIVRSLGRVVDEGTPQQVELGFEDALWLGNTVLNLYNLYFDRYDTLFGMTLDLLGTDSLRCLCWWLFIRVMVHWVGESGGEGRDLDPRGKDIANTLERHMGEESLIDFCAFTKHYMNTLHNPGKHAMWPYVTFGIEAFLGCSQGNNLLVRLAS